MAFFSVGAKTSPTLDAESFQQLLAAAYVLQQHNENLRAKNPRLDPASILSEIAKTESQVREGNLDVGLASELIASRLCNLTEADGVSICLLNDGYLECVAQSGAAIRVPGGSVACNSLAATDSLRTGKLFDSPDAQTDVRLELSLCRELDLGSLLAAPIQHTGGLAGLIELRWQTANAIHECDQRTCDLMAGLMGHLLDRNHASEGVVTTGRSQGLNAASGPAPQQIGHSKNEISDIAPMQEKASQALATHCPVCGRVFGADEEFCGNCSMVRTVSTSRQGLQSKWARMWFMQKAQGELEARTVQNVAAPTYSRSQPVTESTFWGPRGALCPIEQREMETNASGASMVAERDASAPSDVATEDAPANSGEAKT